MDKTYLLKQLEMMKSRTESDEYFKANIKRLMNSVSVLDGTITKQISKLHTTELKQMYSRFVIMNVFSRCGLFDMDKDIFLKYCSECYDQNKICIEIAIDIQKNTNKSV